MERITHHFDVVTGHKTFQGNDQALHHACSYTRPAYVVFLLVACGLIYWMVVDIVEMFKSPNRYMRRHESKSTFFNTVVPMLGFLRDFTIIIAVMIFSEGMLWIAITILFVSMVFGEINQFIAYPKNYLLSPKNWSDILQIILMTVILYVPNDIIVDPMYFSLSRNIAKLCPKNETTY